MGVAPGVNPPTSFVFKSEGLAQSPPMVSVTSEPFWST